MIMKGKICLVILLLFIVGHVMPAQEREDAVLLFCATNIRKSFGKEYRWTAGLLSEYRHQFHEGVSAPNQYFVRPSIAFQVRPWMRLQYQMDFIASASSGFNWGFLPEITLSHKAGDFTFAFRQRVMTIWAVKAGTNSTVLRSRAKVDYSIPKTPLGIYVSLEPYWCEFSKTGFSWLQKTRWCAALNIKITDNLTFTPEYEYLAYHNRSGRYNRRTYDDHVIYMTLSVKL